MAVKKSVDNILYKYLKEQFDRIFIKIFTTVVTVDDLNNCKIMIN